MCIRDSLLDQLRMADDVAREVGVVAHPGIHSDQACELCRICLLYTSDAADERSSVDLGGRRIIKKKRIIEIHVRRSIHSISIETLRAA